MISRKSIIFLLIIFALCLTSVFYVFWSFPKKEEKREETSEPLWIEIKEAGETLNLEIVPYEEPTLIYKEWRVLRDYLNQKLTELGWKVELKVAKDYRSAINDVGLGVADLAILSPTIYLEGRRDFCVSPLLTLKWKEEGERCVLVARKDSDINSFSDIKGKSFAYSDEKSYCGSLLAHKLMRENNIVYNTDFKVVRYFPNYSAVLEAITRGEFDVGMVRKTVFEKSNLPNLKVVFTSEPIFSDFVLVSTFDFDKNLAENIIKILEEIPPQIMTQINPNYEGWKRVADEEYEELRKEIKEIHGLDYFLPTPDFCKIKPKCKLTGT